VKTILNPNRFAAPHCGASSIGGRVVVNIVFGLAGTGFYSVRLMVLRVSPRYVSYGTFPELGTLGSSRLPPQLAQQSL
jgi:hypothetical protein